MQKEHQPVPKPEMVVVVPAPDLPLTRYVRGIPATGKALPRSMADQLIKSGLVVIREPEKPATEKESD